jgi:hypothetical protein
MASTDASYRRRWRPWSETNINSSSCIHWEGQRGLLPGGVGSTNGKILQIDRLTTEIMDLTTELGEEMAKAGVE